MILCAFCFSVVGKLAVLCDNSLMVPFVAVSDFVSIIKQITPINKVRL